MSAPSQSELILTSVVGLGRALREAGVAAGPSRIQDALLALSTVELSDGEQVYWALRCTLVSRSEDIDPFDEVFARAHQPEPSTQPDLNPGATPKADRQQPTDEPLPGGDREVGETELTEDREEEQPETEAGMRFSAVERLRQLDFALYTDVELRRAAQLLPRLARAMPLRRSRRLRTAGAGAVFDTRRMLRESMRSDGYPLVRQWRAPRLVPRKLVFVDVSGSMQPYARAMMMFLQTAVRAGRTVEAFTFGTRLTRVTRELQGRDPDRALQAATGVVRDWAGGTRIGENLRALNEDWGRMGLTRGGVVVIVSDGWERGDIDALVTQMERLQRASHTVIWVNPLAGEPGYEPLAQGMAASLPYVDHFLPGHNLHSFETLAEVLEGLPRHGRRDGGGAQALR
jgi:uncharacterized protein with von Willebrand factor type A (vWA) domain